MVWCVLNGQLQTHFRSSLNQREDGVDKGRHSLVMIEVNIDEHRPEVSRQVEIFPKQLDALRAQQVCLPTRMDGETHAAGSGRFGDLLTGLAIEIGLIPAGTRFFIREPFKGVKDLSQRIVERFSWGSCPTGGLVSDVYHAQFKSTRPVAWFARTSIHIAH